MSLKEYLKDYKIIILLLIIVALAFLDVHYGIHFGIDFAGGTLIPVSLEHSANATTMGTMISDLQQRVSTFGLKQVTVEGVGNSEIYITIPSISPADVNSTINIIQSQGTFVGVVNGTSAINGSDILKGSIGSISPQLANNTYTWAVQFFITAPSMSTFAKAVFGQANKPLYMYLDRPTGALILINSSILGNASLGLSPSKALSLMQSSLALGNQTIPVISVSNSNASIASAEKYISSNPKYTKIYASYNLNSSLISYLKSTNRSIYLQSAENMTPQFTAIAVNETIMESWGIVGLLSAPILNPSLTTGNVSDSYEISGIAPLTLPKGEQLSYATNQEKTIASILSGGALPIAVIPGVPSPVSPTLGKQSLVISGVIGLAAIIAISIFITIRYKKLFLIAPILLTTFAELFVITSIIGLIGTIDLAAVAGIIAVVGTGVDAQIIITDEMLSHGSGQTTARSLISKAFYIIWMDAILLIMAMMPLFFSTSMVTVIGFSEATIIGALLGVLITRPAYGAILSRHFG
ncbi:SecD/SecF/SecDF export membrane protein [mine drainage metagenome]|uniref:SecD/SecF/SecDF export membrane protein n=1 Tax=mine drainage metagenome TaxID=410659 RepID=T1B0T3_9ZZZZ